METLDRGHSPFASVDYVADPNFSFPQLPEDSSPAPTGIPRRAASLHITPSTPRRGVSAEPRSAPTLPSFSFNAVDTSGRSDRPLDTHIQNPTTPSLVARSHGHRRGASELVGGSARHGRPDFVTASPVKPFDFAASPADNATQGSPIRKRGHAHRRSAAVSAHDLSGIMQPRDALIINAGEPIPSANTLQLDSNDDQADSVPSTPPPPPSSARPRVGFSSNIEIIPRPLSTISSEAESIISLNAASGSSSQTSPLRSSNFSPSTRRRTRSARSSLSEVEFAMSEPESPSARTPLEREGYLLQNEPERPMTDSRVNFRDVNSPRDFTFPPATMRLNLDRRSSEPSLSAASLQKPRRSSVSLREPLQKAQPSPVDSVAMPSTVKRKSSASRVKAWASSKIFGKDKKLLRKSSNLAPEQSGAQPRSSMDATTPSSEIDEPDFEALFSNDPFSQPEDESVRLNRPAPHMDMSNLRPFAPSSASDDMEDSGAVIDLDIALGAAGTPSRDGRSPGLAARRQLHSSRTNREFSSPINIYHRRAESAPALTPFDFPKSPSPLHSPMADVFEEEEEDDTIATPSTTQLGPPAFSFPSTPLDGPVNAEGGAVGSQEHLQVPVNPLEALSRPASTLGQDLSTEHLVIVEDHEEPRASTITKSSDSSDTPTVLADMSLEINDAVSTVSFIEPPASPTSRHCSFDVPRIGTSASSAADTRTISSCTSDRHDARPSVDDVPSLTSSRSTMISGMRRDTKDRPSTSGWAHSSSSRDDQRRRKRASIQSLTKLMSGPFGDSKSRLNLDMGNQSSPDLLSVKAPAKKRENRLSRLMFWKDKAAQK